MTLDFLQAPPPLDQTTWGKTLFNGFNLLLAGEWWVSFFPAAMVLLAILGVNLLGDGLRDAIDGLTRDPLVEMVEDPKGRRWSLGRLARAAGEHPHRSIRSAIESARSCLATAGALTRILRLRPFAQYGVTKVAVISRLPRSGAWFEATRKDRSVPTILALAPLLLVFGLSEIIFLVGHAPATYAPNYSPPLRYATVYSLSDYASQPMIGGGWDIFYVDSSNRLVFQRLDSHARVLTAEVLATSAGQWTQPAMAGNGHRWLGVWIAHRRGRAFLQAGYLGSRRPNDASVITVASAATIEHPTVVATPHGGFDVLFGGQRSTGVDLYLAAISPKEPPGKAARSIQIRRLVHARFHALLPHAVVDGGGSLDVLYLDECCNAGAWTLKFGRYTVGGRPLGRAETLGQITSLTEFGRSADVPQDWGLDIARAPDGSVWAAGMSDDGVTVAHWSAAGQTLLGPQPLACRDAACAGADQHTLGMVLLRTGSFLYFLFGGAGEGQHPYSTPFDKEGTALPSERMAYDYGGGASSLHAGLSGGAPAIMWENLTYSGQSILEGTSYHPASPPDLGEWLGLDVGPVWANLAVAVIGSIVAGVPLTAINVLFLSLLILPWAAVSRLIRGRARWPVYLMTLTLVLALSFARAPTAPAFVLALRPWGSPYGWILVAGAVFVSGWAGFGLLRHQDDWFRASAMALLAVYFIAVMCSLTGIQAELAQI